MLNLFRRKPRTNPTKTEIVRHDGKSSSTKQIRWDLTTGPTSSQLERQAAVFEGFESPPGRF